VARLLRILKDFATAWLLGRQVGRALRRRQNGDLAGALRMACDGVASAARSPVPSASPAILTPMLELTLLADEVAEELAHPELAQTVLREMANYWDRAVMAQPTLADFDHANERIGYFRRRIQQLERGG
jgi:hypothetical protein